MCVVGFRFCGRVGSVYIVDVRLAGAVGQASHVDAVPRGTLEVRAAVSIALRPSCADTSNTQSAGRGAQRDPAQEVTSSVPTSVASPAAVHRPAAAVHAVVAAPPAAAGPVVGPGPLPTPHLTLRLIVSPHLRPAGLEDLDVTAHTHTPTHSKISMYHNITVYSVQCLDVMCCEQMCSM